MAIWKRAKFSFRQKLTWLQETGAAAAGAARGFHWIKVTRSLAGLAELPSKMPWTKIRATLFPFSAVSEPRNDFAVEHCVCEMFNKAFTALWLKCDFIGSVLVHLRSKYGEFAHNPSDSKNNKWKKNDFCSVVHDSVFCRSYSQRMTLPLESTLRTPKGHFQIKDSFYWLLLQKSYDERGDRRDRSRKETGVKSR
jgi:hypothetical protein